MPECNKDSVSSFAANWCWCCLVLQVVRQAGLGAPSESELSGRPALAVPHQQARPGRHQQAHDALVGRAAHTHIPQCEK